MPQDDMIQALMQQQMAGMGMQHPASMLNTPPPSNGMIGGITGEGGNGEPGGLMHTLMSEYMNQIMKNPHEARKFMQQQQRQGEDIMRAVPRPWGNSVMGPR